MKKRWQFMAAASVFLASPAAAAAGDVGTSKSYHGPTGLQLYSLRDMQTAEGVEATLDKAVALGFKYVEVADLGKFSPAEFKQQLDRRGLVPIGRHFSYEQLRDDVESVARDAKALGIPYVGCAGFRTRIRSPPSSAARRLGSSIGSAPRWPSTASSSTTTTTATSSSRTRRGPSSTCS